MPFSLINQTQNRTWTQTRSIIKNIMKVALEAHLLNVNHHLNVILVLDNAMHELNLMYKGKDYPTDVLTFVSDDEDTLADIFINMDACTRQAQEYQHSFKREFAFLFAHALLHACGYDHENESDEGIMIAKQKELLREYPREL
jgi:probable rRNA maturation factor